MAQNPELVAYAAKIEIKRETPLSNREWMDKLCEFFDTLAKSCKENKNVVIGHIKGFLELNNVGYCYLSTVGNSQGTTVKGDLQGSGSSYGKFDLNVLLYGLDKDVVGSMVQDEIKRLASRIKGNYRIELAG